MTETWNDHQLLEAVADYLADGKLRPLLDLGFKDKREIGVGLRLVSARIRQLEGMASRPVICGNCGGTYDRTREIESDAHGIGKCSRRVSEGR